MRAVAHQLRFLHPTGFQQVLRIEDTAVTVDLAEGIQHEGTGPAGRVHGPSHSRFPAHLAERIPPMPPRVRLHVHQLAGAVAVGHQLRRGQALEGRDQAVVPVDVDVEPGDDVVERELLRGELVVLAGHLVQGVGHVERVVLLLRVQHQGQLVAPLHHLHELGPLPGAAAHRPLGPLRGRQPGGTELVPQHGERLREVLLVQHRIRRNQRHQRQDEDQ